jgi:hypothetical protein
MALTIALVGAAILAALLGVGNEHEFRCGTTASTVPAPAQVPERDLHRMR